MAHQCLEIRSLNEQCSSLCLSLPGCKEEIVVSGQDNLLQSSFSELTMLYFANVKLTCESVIGNLISCDEDCGHFCGSVLPLPVLSTLVDKALEADSVRTFFQVAACLCKLTVQESPHSAQSIISSGKSMMRKSIELPANSIWSLLILSEVLGVDMVMMDCKQKMAKMLAAGKGGDGSRLPACIMEGIESEYIKDIESKLTAHLLMYGIGSPKRSNEEASSLIHASVATNSPSRKHQSQGLSALSETSVTSGSNSTYESTGSSAFFSDDEDGNRGVNQRQIETPRNKFTNLKVHYQSPTANTDSEKSFRDDDQEDVRRIPKNHSFPNHQFAYPRDQVQAYVGSKSVADDSSEISSIHSINSWSVNADESHYLRSSRYSASNNKSQPTIARPQFTSPPTYQQPSTNDQPMRMSDINYQQQQHIGRIQREHSNYSSSPQPILQQQQHNSLEEYPKTLWQTSQVHPHRSQSPDFKLQARASSPNSPHDGHVSRSSSPRWNVSTRAESRSSSPSALSGSQSKALTGEDLKLSRDIAKLRLREVKIKTELEASKLSAEKALRDNKLKSLELKAAVLRLGSSGSNNFKSPKAGNSSKSRPSSAPRPRSTLHQSIKLDANTRSLEREFEIAEEARIRALQRIKEKKREIAAMEQKRVEEKQQKQAEMWKTRDEKIARFIDQQQYRQPMQSAEKNVETQSPIAMNKVPFSNTANRIAGNTQPHNPPPQYISTAKLATNQQTQIEVDEPPSSCGMYTKEALEAVGLGYSPSTIQPNPIRSKTLEDVTFEQYRASRQTQSPLQVQTPSSTRTEPKRYQRAVELPPPPPLKILEPPKQMDTIDFNIVRCWDLPESLGGTNPYVLLNNPSFGQAKTACVFNSTQPYFGSILSLNCPKQAWKRENGNDDLVNFDGMEASVVQIFVYNKNQSISDEMIAYGEHDLMAMVGVKHSIIVDLYDSNRNPTGYVEIAARYRE